MKFQLLIIIYTFLFSSPIYIYSQNYCSSGASSPNFGYIKNVTFHTINNTSPTGCGQTYSDFTTIAAQVEVGDTHQLSVQILGCSPGNYNHVTKAWIDWNRNGLFEQSEEVLSHGPALYGTITSTVIIPSTAIFGPTRMRIVTVESNSMANISQCNTYIYGETEDYTIDVKTPFNNDVSLASIDQPSQPFCGLTNQALVSITNNGKDTLDSCLIHLKVGRIGTPNLNTTTAWYGNLASGLSISNVNAGTLPGGFQIGDTVTIYTSMPNGVPDSSAISDTISIVLFPGLSGTFIIGDVVNSGADYASFNAAITALNSYPGICDTVTFLIQDSTYVEQIQLLDILGASALRPIIFKSISGNPANVILRHNSINTASNYTVLLKNAHNYIFKDLSISNNGITNASVISFTDGASENYFENITFGGKPSTTTSTNFAVITSSGTNNCDLNTFTNCRINNGSKGVYFASGSGQSRNTGNVFTHCNFTNQYAGFAFFFNQKELHFKNNTLISNSVYQGTDSYGLYVYNSTNGIEISRNSIHSTGDFPETAIFIENTNALANSKNVLHTNDLHVGFAASNYLHKGIHIKNSSQLLLAYNSILALGSSNSNTALHLEHSDSVSLYNNNLANLGNGFALSIDSATNYSTNHNNFYSTGQSVASIDTSNFITLADLIAFTEQDSNSVSVNPQFHSLPTDLHVCNQSLSKAGIPIAGITTDFDDDIRHASTPDIGVDEFTPLTIFSLGNDTGICSSFSTQFGMPLKFGDMLIWSTGDTTDFIQISNPMVLIGSLINNCGIKTDTITISQDSPVSIIPAAHLCPDSSLTLNVSYPNATHLWSTGSTSSSLTLQNPGTFHVVRTDKWGCVSSDTIVVTKSNTVTLNTDIPDKLLCSGFTGFLEAVLLGGINVTYRWNDTSTASIRSINTGGTYWVEANDRGCLLRDTIIINDMVTPKLDFGYKVNFLNLIIDNNKSVPTNADVLWNFGNGDISNTFTPFHTYASSGVYNVTVVLSNLCGVDSESFTVEAEAVSVNEIYGKSKVEIFPNPAKDFLYIKKPNSSNLHLRIIDVNGKVVLSDYITNDISTVSTHQLNSGFYFVLLTNENESYSNKFIKE